MATAAQSVTSTETTHTNAEYRCKVQEIRKNFYIVKMVNIAKNHGDRKTLHIPRRDLFVKKDLISEKLQQYDYINLKLTYINRRYNVTEVLSFDKLQRVSNEDVKNKSLKEKQEIRVEKINPNKYAALAWSDSDSDEDN